MLYLYYSYSTVVEFVPFSASPHSYLMSTGCFYTNDMRLLIGAIIICLLVTLQTAISQDVRCSHCILQPRLSGPPLSGTLIIWLDNIFFLMGVSLKCAHAHCSCYHGDRPAYLLRMRRQPCGTAVYQLSGWIKTWFI